MTNMVRVEGHPNKVFGSGYSPYQEVDPRHAEEEGLNKTLVLKGNCGGRGCGNPKKGVGPRHASIPNSEAIGRKIQNKS